MTEADKRAIRLIERVTIHTVPIGDVYMHVASKECWCMPITKNKGRSYVHYARDLREEVHSADSYKSPCVWTNIAEYVTLEDV